MISRSASVKPRWNGFVDVRVKPARTGISSLLDCNALVGVVGSTWEELRAFNLISAQSLSSDCFGASVSPAPRAERAGSLGMLELSVQPGTRRRARLQAWKGWARQRTSSASAPPQPFMAYR